MDLKKSVSSVSVVSLCLKAYLVGFLLKQLLFQFNLKKGGNMKVNELKSILRIYKGREAEMRHFVFNFYSNYCRKIKKERMDVLYGF